MKFLRFLFIVIFFQSCFKSCQTIPLSGNKYKEAKKICLNSEGQGRLTVKNSKYVFDYDSIYEKDNFKWSLALDFPLRSEETFELDWSEKGKMKFRSSIDQKILRENSDVNPRELDRFIKAMGHFLKDLVKLQNKSKQKLAYRWNLNKEKMWAKSPKGSSQLEFSELNADGYFKMMSISYQGKKEQSYKMEFIVRKCFKKE